MPYLARKYGHIKGVPVGTHFNTRRELLNAGVHGEIRGGIHGDPKEGAFSICLSGGYEDDEYLDDKIIYVGTGGQLPHGKQFDDQSFEDYRNKSLCISCATKKPVRVVRGTRKIGSIDPGYVYEGLYVVDSYWQKKGRRGFNMCFYQLSRYVKPASNGSTEPSHTGGSKQGVEHAETI